MALGVLKNSCIKGSVGWYSPAAAQNGASFSDTIAQVTAKMEDEEEDTYNGRPINSLLQQSKASDTGQGRLIRMGDDLSRESAAGRNAKYASLSSGEIKNEYFALEKDGVIDYNGVQFSCDHKSSTIFLGDCSDMDNCIRVSLSKGGSFVFNRDCMGDIGKAMSMFAPEDINRILHAIQKDKIAQKALWELEEDKNSDGQKKTATKEAEETKETQDGRTNDNEDLLSILRSNIEEMRERLKNGDKEPSFQIGAQSFTLKEWDKFMSRFDAIQEDIQKSIEEEIEKKKEEQQEEEVRKNRQHYAARA